MTESGSNVFAYDKRYFNSYRGFDKHADEMRIDRRDILIMK